MSEPLLSVVIPTFNRRAILVRCLDALAEQSLPSEAFEVVLIDDGSSDGTPEAVEGLLPAWGGRLRYYRQSNRGPAAARNRGVREAVGELVLFMGDDIIAHPEMLSRHLRLHQLQPQEEVAVLGLTTWDSGRPVTPFMWWLENGGPQYKYWAISHPENAGYVHFYTSNISLKRAFLLSQGLFDEDFPYAAYEDIELGWRLEQQGLRIVYDREAVGYHDHATRLRDALRRMENVGVSRRIFLNKIGQTPPQTTAVRGPASAALAEAKFGFLYGLGRLAEKRFVLPGVYSYLMDRSLWRGYWRNGTAL